MGHEDGLIGAIFRKAQDKLSDPAKLTRLVSLIDKEGPWIDLKVDVKGETRACWSATPRRSNPARASTSLPAR